jgi:hypothetical protein
LRRTSGADLIFELVHLSCCLEIVPQHIVYTDAVSITALDLTLRAAVGERRGHEAFAELEPAKLHSLQAVAQGSLRVDFNAGNHAKLNRRLPLRSQLLWDLRLIELLGITP